MVYGARLSASRDTSVHVGRAKLLGVCELGLKLIVIPRQIQVFRGAVSPGMKPCPT